MKFFTPTIFFLAGLAGFALAAWIPDEQIEKRQAVRCPDEQCPEGQLCYIQFTTVGGMPIKTCS